MQTINEKIGLNHVIRGYRYSSLIISSLFYVVASRNSLDIRSIGVLVGMSLCCFLTDYLYQESKNHKKNTCVVVFIEIIANTILINMSGGLNSYYIWYSLNSVLMLTLIVGEKWSWLNLCFYMFTMLSHKAITGENNLNIVDLNILLGLILVTATFQWIIGYQKVLLEKNKRLTGRQNQAKESLDYIMDTYETVYLFANEKSKEKVIEILFDYIALMLKTTQVAYLEVQEDGKLKVYHRDLSKGLVKEIYSKVGKYLLEEGMKEYCSHISYKGKGYDITPIMHSHEYFGTLIIQIEQRHEEITFMTYLTSMTLKRIQLEKVYESFVISAEQNRIANHIHDGILQKLFGISCGLYGLGKTIGEKSDEQIENEINELRVHINNAMTELRETIYGMSWNKGGNSRFREMLQRYVDEMRYLYKREVFLEIRGDIQKLGHRHKEVIYRVICEGISNAIRHGKAHEVHVTIQVECDRTLLVIKDNGIGFNYEEIVERQLLGLGIRNMQYLASTLGGVLKINSRLGEGTEISLEFIAKDVDLSRPYSKGDYKEDVYEITDCG